MRHMNRFHLEDPDIDFLNLHPPSAPVVGDLSCFSAEAEKLYMSVYEQNGVESDFEMMDRLIR